MRIAYVVESSRGLGHVSRAHKILSALSEVRPTWELFAIADNPFLAHLDPHDRYWPIVRGARPDRATTRRDMTRLLLAELAADLIIASHWRCLTTELATAVPTARAAGVPTVLALRDVVGQPAIAPALETAFSMPAERAVESLLAGVMVFGRSDVFSIEADVPFLRAANVRYCGYVAPVGVPHHAPTAPRDRRSKRVVCAVGGGHGSEAVIEAVAASWTSVASDQTLELYMGSGIDETVVAQMIALDLSKDGVTAHMLRPDWYASAEAADVFVCTGGYNLLTEALYFGIPTICVPRIDTKDDYEQSARAAAFERFGVTALKQPIQACVLCAAIEAASLSPAIQIPDDFFGTALEFAEALECFAGIS